VVTTLMAKGAFPDSHRQHLGMPGMHGTVSAVSALQKADLLITLGARFDDRVTGKLDTFAPHALIIHADVDPAEELPVALQFGLHHPIGGRGREAIQEFMQLLGAENGQQHALVEVASATIDAHAPADQRSTAITAHQIVGLQHLLPGQP